MSTIFRPYVEQKQRSDRSSRDRKRHRAKIRDSIRENIADIISEESIIGADKNKVIKIPIRSIKEYRFIYGENSPKVSQGEGKTEEGDDVKEGQAGQPDASGEAGETPGVDVFETDISLAELVEIMFEDLELPDLEKKSLREIDSERQLKRKGYKHEGIRARLDKRRTAKNRIKRKLASRKRLGVREDITESDRPTFPFHREDMRYHRVSNDTNLQSNAVIVCIMDTSGSMGTVKKYLARSFYFLLFQFVRKKYQKVEVLFIAHHTEANEVNEEDFFHKVESGGTYVSSGYEKALEIIESRYHPSLWNVYAFHCSDGDNFYSDNDKALAAANKLCEVCNLFGYGEIKPTGSAYYSGSMLEVFSDISHDNFQAIVIEKKEDLWSGFRSFLMKDASIAGALADINSEAGESDDADT